MMRVKKKEDNNASLGELNFKKSRCCMPLFGQINYRFQAVFLATQRPQTPPAAVRARAGMRPCAWHLKLA